MNHRTGRALFAVGTGLIVAWFAYAWITDPVPRAERRAEEQAVRAARGHLVEQVTGGQLEIVDPLAPNRKIGKVYVYREAPGWAVSGYYRRHDRDRWHPYLIHLAEDLALHSFRAEDAALDPT